MAQNSPFEGRVALVTGASRGIGAATAKALAAKGVKTIINTRLPSEDQGELPPERAKAEVEALGMTYLNIPVSSSEFSDESLAEVSRAISEAAAEGETFVH